MNIFTGKYGYLTDVKEMTYKDYQRMDVRYMCSTDEGINIYEERMTGELYYITDDEMKKL